MSLDGYLEDLSVCDILQILSLSKKTGTLLLKSQCDEGSISFSEGQVIRAFSSCFPEGLGQLLCYADVITQEQVDSALLHQTTVEYQQPLE